MWAVLIAISLRTHCTLPHGKPWVGYKCAASITLTCKQHFHIALTFTGNDRNIALNEPCELVNMFVRISVRISLRVRTIWVQDKRSCYYGIGSWIYLCIVSKSWWKGTRLQQNRCNVGQLQHCCHAIQPCRTEVWSSWVLLTWSGKNQISGNGTTSGYVSWNQTTNGTRSPR